MAGTNFNQRPEPVPLRPLLAVPKFLQGLGVKGAQHTGTWSAHAVEIASAKRDGTIVRHVNAADLVLLKAVIAAVLEPGVPM